MLRGLAALLLLVALAILLPVLGASAQPRDLPDPRLVVHEWGVLKLEQGRITHLEELAAELPPFVVRRNGAPAPVPPPIGPLPPGPPPPVARKPVVFLYTDRPTTVLIEVGFRSGAPWLHWPMAEVTQGGHGIRFEGMLFPRADAALPPVSPGHFWEDLRSVSPSLFVTTGGGSAERFLFYDGPVDLERPFLVARSAGGAVVTPLSTERTLWLVDQARFTEIEITRGTGSGRLVAEGDMATLRTRLSAELRARGLFEEEARSLVETWRDDLFASPAQRAIYFVPRDLYDRMLPILIDPPPVEVARVGLIIEHL